MTSYPRQSRLFIAWSKAMVAGATVDKPTYPGSASRKASKGRAKPQKGKQRRRRRKRKNAKKD